MAYTAWPLTLDFGQFGGNITFRSPNDLSEFITNEERVWRGIEQKLDARYQDLLNPIRKYLSEFRSFEQVVLNGARPPESWPQSFRQNVGQWCPLPAITPAAQAIISMSEVDPVSAAIVLGRVTGSDADLRMSSMSAAERAIVRRAQAIGDQILTGSYDALPASLVQSVEHATNKATAILAAASDAVLRAREETSAFVKLSNDALREQHENLTEALSKAAMLVQQCREAQEQELSEARERLSKLDVALREKISLKAPVDYWNTKAESHKGSALIFAYASAALATLILVIILFIWHKAPDLNATINTTAGFPAGLLVGAATSALALTILFWATRIAVRMMLSHVVQWSDAKERAVMTETYLSLTSEKAASDEDRKLILGALFRTGSIQVSIEDSAPETSISGLISKVLSGGKA